VKKHRKTLENQWFGTPGHFGSVIDPRGLPKKVGMRCPCRYFGDFGGLRCCGKMREVKMAAIFFPFSEPKMLYTIYTYIVVCTDFFGCVVKICFFI